MNVSIKREGVKDEKSVVIFWRHIAIVKSVRVSNDLVNIFVFLFWTCHDMTESGIGTGCQKYYL